VKVGLFNELDQWADYLWNQCDGPMGRHGDLELVRWGRDADRVFVMNWPSPPGGARRAIGWKRHLWKLFKKPTAPLRAEYGYRWLGRDRADVDVMLYEPPEIIPEWLMALSKAQAGRVFAPDDRATHRVRLPAMWTVPMGVKMLRELSPRATEKGVGVVAVSSGSPPGKRLVAGHVARLGFYERLAREGAGLELFGRGLPASTGARGPVQDKASVLFPARLALVIENSGAEGYVTEKLWDALACWCVPVYFGSRAADEMIPPEAMVRLPDLGARGAETLREALADGGLWERKLEALAEARKRMLGELRLVEWLARNVGGR
jgi:hypothetical protein